MTRRFVAVLFAALLAISMVGAAFAAQDVVGQPGEPNCFGLRTSLHASGGDAPGGPQGNPSQRANQDERFNSVKDVQNHVKNNCDHPGNSQNAPGHNKGGEAE